ncbi:MAG: flagellar basal body rod protein FlgB [Pseudomonadota bacterium]
MAFDLFGPTYSLLSKVLDLRSQRHTLISSNVANADTPGYKAGAINFEDELNKMLPSNSKLKLSTTNEKHMPMADPDFSDLKPSIVLETGKVQRVDGNTVDLEKEVVEMSKNQLMYGAMTQIIKKKIEGLQSAISGTK